MSGTWKRKLVKFCRLRLGMKPILDYAQARTSLIGVGGLPIRTVLDIGANVGRKARHYRRLFPEATLYCFEPVPDCHQKLAKWARRQGGKVRCFDFALGDQPGETTLHWNTTHPGGSTLIAGRHGRDEKTVELPVRVERLDTVAADLHLEDDLLVKIDVEGFDMQVIRGGMAVMRRAAAAIIEISLFDRPTDRPGFAHFLATMSDLGYLYRGNLSQAYVEGVPRAVDAVFIRPREQQRAAA